MLRKNLGILVVLGLVVLFLYYASYFYDPTHDKKNAYINYTSDAAGMEGMVVSASSYASKVGIDILKKGGNAIDASVAVGFALAVTYPQAGNIGGGGFMVLRVHDSIITSIDYREKAPSASTRNMYLDSSGKFDPDLSQFGHLSSGVPGSVAGMLYALEKYGTMSRDEVMQPAIDLAENGFEIEPKFAESLNANFDDFSEFPSTKKIFTKKNSLNFFAGEKFVQKDLASTLRRIRDDGRDGFYKGVTADMIENEMVSNDGIITKEDLANYQPVERNVISTNYKGYDVYSMAPPSSGGIALINLLNMIEHDPVPDTNNSIDMANYYHTVIESMKRVYADRSEYLGDPDFYKIPQQELIDKSYSKERRREITDSITPSSEIKPGLGVIHKESDQTTHYSVIDKYGNMVSVTTTLNNTYGSCVVVNGAGFLLNDEMDDFASKPGEPNMFGLIGSDANSIQPNKRMLSSMTPTLILKDGKPLMILGSPGGGKIITSVFLTILNVLDFKLPLHIAIDKPRFHHQWLPVYLQTEQGAFDTAVTNILQQKGHRINEIGDYGNVCAILIDWNRHIFYGHADRRGYGIALSY
ncbi:MAG: gamma-glutamyltransferase [Ignavibacteriae bacterium]|nr:MAG: gamma-glutamyltransferase [Ignavibacteriota bacterium]